MWIYHQKTGQMFDPSGKLFATGYAGNGQWKNDPDSDHVKGHGPLCRGDYVMGAIVEGSHLGPHAIRLDPVATNDMKGRGSFYIHGDSISHPGEASDGCICFGPGSLRLAMWNHPDNILRVVA